MEEDWSIGANAPTFSLFRNADPSEEAEKDTFVELHIYNQWKKAERRLYHRLKSAKIARELDQRKIRDYDDLTNALETLNILKSHSTPRDPTVDALISRVENLKIDASRRKEPT